MARELEKAQWYGCRWTHEYATAAGVGWCSSSIVNGIAIVTPLHAGTTRVAEGVHGAGQRTNEAVEGWRYKQFGSNKGTIQVEGSIGKVGDRKVNQRGEKTKERMEE